MLSPVKIVFEFTPIMKRHLGSNLQKETRIAIHVLNKFGMPLDAMAKLFCTQKKSIKSVLAKKTIFNQKGQGRHQKTTKKETRKILKVCKNNRRRGTDVLALEIARKYDIYITGRTIRNRLRDCGIWWGFQRKKYLMTKNDIATRFDFAIKYKNKSWKRFDIHHDESFFNLNPNHRRSRIFPTDKFQTAQKHFLNLKFECFVTSEFKSKLYFWKGRRDSKHWVNHFKCYRKELQDTHVDVREDKCKFWFDKAPCHKSKYSRAYYNRKKINYELFCNKPCEINVCEQIWGRIKQYAWSKNPKTLVEAKSYLLEEYSNITQADLRLMFKRIPQRLKKIENSMGGKTEYWTDYKNGVKFNP